MADSLGFRRVVRARRLISERKCPGCEMDYKPQLTKLETELRDLKALHADIIDQGRKVQIAASGESKYGAMSAGEYIEWVAEMLEGKCQVLS